MRRVVPHVPLPRFVPVVPVLRTLPRTLPLVLSLSILPLVAALCLAPARALPAAGRPAERPADPRRFEEGNLIPSEGYCDQPYVVRMEDGTWLCVLTTGKGREGDPGQHVVATRSSDRGRTWSELVDIEPADGPEASWAVPLVTPSGRVYAFYDYNGDRVTSLPGRPPGIRADTLGWYCYRYSDDGGRTWSEERFRLPMRVTACDRGNQWKGDVQVFWGIDKPKAADGVVRFAFTKLGRYMLEEGEGWLYVSPNILTERDPARIAWDLLPEGDRGIRADPFGSVQEEHNIVPLGGGRLYCVYRTAMGFPCHSYSDDGGRSWTTPEPMTYRPGGRRVRNPRACPKLWKTEDGRYLFWFHLNGNKSFNQGDRYGSRNIAWLTAGRARDGRMHWAEPEIVRYCTNPLQGASYPDLIEDGGRTYISATQKTEARIGEVSPDLLDGLFRQDELCEPPERGLVVHLQGEATARGTTRMPRLPSLEGGGGFALDLWARLESLEPGQVLVDSRDPKGAGVWVSTAAGGTLRIHVSDGALSAGWDTDPGLLGAGTLHHIVFIVDGGPKVISSVVDGALCEGGGDEKRPYGYGRFLRSADGGKLPAQAGLGPGREIGDVSGSVVLRIARSVIALRVYDRYIRTSEAVGSFRAGLR